MKHKCSESNYYFYFFNELVVGTHLGQQQNEILHDPVPPLAFLTDEFIEFWKDLE